MSRATCLLANYVLLSFLLAPTSAWSLQWQASCMSSSALSATTDDDRFSFEVTYDGRTLQVEIEQDESILAAMERSGVIEDVPSDCRRGNCLTCVGRHSHGSQESSLQRDADGLSPHMSKELAERGHILLCSSYVSGDGLKLELGQNYRAWDEMYRQRVEDESMRRIGLEAVAKAMRLRSEANVEEWKEETENMLENSGNQ